MTEKLLSLGVKHHPTLIEYCLFKFPYFHLTPSSLLNLGMLKLDISHFENSLDLDQLAGFFEPVS